MSCCPHGSWGELQSDADYLQRGTVDVVGADLLPVYRVGQSNRCVLWNYDIFGFDGGRTRQLCDQLADKGYMVLLPDYFRGKTLDPRTASADEMANFIKEQTHADVIRETWAKTLKPYAVGHGAEVFGTVGTCWGSYAVLKLSALPDFKAGVSMHPSHTRIMRNVLQEDETATLEATRGTPQLFMPAGNDDPNDKVGGLAQEVLKEDLVIVEFPDMLHGWTARGDLADAKVVAEVKRAMVEAATFFDKHLQ